MSKTIDFDGYKVLIVILVIMGILTFLTFVFGETVIEYEYETVDGETGVATYCDTPLRSVPYCVLDDGTRIYSIKKYKVLKKEQE